MTKPVPAQYRTTNWKDYNAALKARASLSVWLGRDMVWRLRLRVGLHLLVDSTGMKMLGDEEWKTKKHGAEYRR